MSPPGAGWPEVVTVEGLSMRYHRLDALRDLTLRVRRGEMLALLGPNGAGKTTTVEILEGFRRPSAGQVRVLDVDPMSGDQRWRARMGIVLQSWRDHSRWRVREFLAYQASFYRPYAVGRTPRSPDVDGLLATVGLTGQARTTIRRLSGGQRRRLDLAVGVVGQPELLFLDEPTAGLDPEARRDFHDLLSRITQELGTTVVMTTHDLDEAEKLADRIVILARGKVIAEGTSQELRRQIAGADEVRWACDGRRFRHMVEDSTAFVRDLFASDGTKISELEVRRASLEDTYLTLVRQAEGGGVAAASSRPRGAA
jgi:ABC-2 type transport system ATP-binding protein